jgi:hypothetical protein
LGLVVTPAIPSNQAAWICGRSRSIWPHRIFRFPARTLGNGGDTIPGNYPPGTTIEGIEWRAPYANLTVTITNPSGLEYNNVDVLALTDTYIARAALRASSNDCHVAAEFPGDAQIARASVDEQLPSGEKLLFPRCYMAQR